MEAQSSHPCPLGTSFAELVEDPRQKRKCRYSLEAIFTIAIVAILAGAENWSQVAVYARVHKCFLTGFLNLPSGRTPSHDTFSRVFRILAPDPLEAWLRAWLSALAQASTGRLIAVDGKTIRGSLDRAADKAGLHMVNAWSDADRMVIGQLATAEKSNEITAVPQLLKTLDLHGAIVTMDAMGCQREHANLIVSKGGHYLMTVKGNQGILHDSIISAFAKNADDSAWEKQEQKWTEQVATTTDKGHGRIEMRRLTASVALEGKLDWPHAAQVFQVERMRTWRGTTTHETAYGITSLPVDQAEAKDLLRFNRGHWGVENKLHWRLDMVFREDWSTTRKDHGPENEARLRRLCLTLLTHGGNDTGEKLSMPMKRRCCGWNPQFALDMLLNPKLNPHINPEFST